MASTLPPSSAVSSGRKARSCLWSRRIHSSDGLFMHTWSISGLSYQSSGYGNSTSSMSSMVMSLSFSMFRMPMCSWMRHQSFLMVLRLLEMPIFLPLRSDILKIVVAGAHGHAAALVHPGRAEQHGAAQVRVHVDRRVQAAHADQVVEVVDVVRVPVVLGRVAEVGVLDADLLELLAAPAELLVHVVGGHHGAVGEPDFVPVQRHRGGDSFCLSHVCPFVWEMSRYRGHAGAASSGAAGPSSPAAPRLPISRAAGSRISGRTMEATST